MDSRRLEEAYQRLSQRLWDRLLNRLFTLYEQNKCRLRANPFLSYAKIFAAKESIIKAVGQKIPWLDMEIRSNDLGAPFVVILGKSKEHLNKIINNCYHIHVSLSDEPPYAQAFVVLSRGS